MRARTGRDTGAPVALARLIERTDVGYGRAGSQVVGGDENETAALEHAGFANPFDFGLDLTGGCRLSQA